MRNLFANYCRLQKEKKKRKRGGKKNRSKVKRTIANLFCCILI